MDVVDNDGVWLVERAENSDGNGNYLDISIEMQHHITAYYTMIVRLYSYDRILVYRAVI